MAMDPNPGKFPILSFVLSRLHPNTNTNPDPKPSPDLEQPPLPSTTPCDLELVTRMPRLNHPEVLASMASAVADVAQTRFVLRSLGERPDHEAVDAARARLAELDGLADAERERCAYRAVVRLDEMHEAYETLLRDAEERLERIYREGGGGEEEEEEEVVKMDEEVERILREMQDGKGKALQCVDLSGRQLRFLPEAFGRMRGLIALDLSNNQLKALPDAIAGLEQLEELRLASNILTHLPDSIGLLLNLKILDVSGNKLKALPDSISNCRLLVELDASYNSITYLPTNVGFGLGKLQKLMIQLNKLRSLPTSICEMSSLRYLDAHFNELHGLPRAFGKLTNLEVLNLSSNFTDLTELPTSFGELVNLRELDLSNNQIHALPDLFGLLENLVKLSLDQNPIVIPPPEVVNKGVKAVLGFMSKRWLQILQEEEQKSLLEATAQSQTGWLTRSTSTLSSWASSFSENVAEYLGVGSKSFKEPYLDRQL